MSRFDEQYLDLCERILRDGEKITTDPAVLKKPESRSARKTSPRMYRRW